VGSASMPIIKGMLVRIRRPARPKSLSFIKNRGFISISQLPTRVYEKTDKRMWNEVRMRMISRDTWMQDGKATGS
jgi:hypothetical protein